MTELMAAVALALTGMTASTSAPAQPETTCPTKGEQSAGALHRRWILEGWEKAPGDGRFSFREKLGHYYDWESPDVVLYDDFDPQHRVARSAAAYAAIWEPIFNTVRSARHAVSDEPAVLATSGDHTASTMEFAALIEGGDGKVTPIRTRSDLVWRCRDGQWRIVREHNSTRVVPMAEVTALLPRARASAIEVD
jgi:ketosteroid isomerase-like protein